MLQRAMQPEDKDKRRHNILDVVELLWMQDPQRNLRVEAVARAVGLAKGTVYLYFSSKEEMLLAVHARHVEQFFEALLAASRHPQSFTLDVLMELIHKHMIQIPAFLPMAGLCTGLMESGVPLESALAFKRRVGEWLIAAGESLQHHFPLQSAEQGVALLMQSYALIIGLWQLLQPSRLHKPSLGDKVLCLMDRDYLTELDVALRALWQGQLAHDGGKP